MKNNVQLITYVDRLTGSNVKGLNSLLNNQLADLFSGVHLLPFYYPIDGSDAGFDPIDHTTVDSRLGSWQDVKHLGQEYDVMADLIVNHMSAQSAEFKDVLAKGKASPYWYLFLTRESVFPEGMSVDEQEKIYRPRPGSCFTEYTLADGTKRDFWTTFTENQIDIDVKSAAGKKYLDSILTKFAESNVSIIRLDAAGYAIKKAGTNCFMLDETFDFIDDLSVQANKLGIKTLVEIHSYYQTQIEIAKRVDQVYDFALPPLILHSLFTKNVDALVKWLSISPRNCITVLDTHDGIGIIDVGPMDGKPGLLTDNEIDQLVEQIHINSEQQSKKATGAAASNVDLYQVNCTYYDAMAKDDFNYLVARAIQFFAPGTPQVYYGGMLAQENDMALLANSNVGRDINRPYLSVEDVEKAQQKPVVKALSSLIKLRNESDAFAGEFSLSGQGDKLNLTWANDECQAQLKLDLKAEQAVVELTTGDTIKSVDLRKLLAGA